MSADTIHNPAAAITGLWKCPVTGNALAYVEKDELERILSFPGLQMPGKPDGGLIDSSRQYFYPVIGEIFLLLDRYAIFLGPAPDLRKGMSFDKKRVFDYYNEVAYAIRDSLNIYEDSPKWVDFREVSSEYIRHSFTRAARYYPSGGKYILDVASGPIGLPEYMALSEGYEYRICMDISVNALLQAKHNMENAGLKGIFVCGDITNIPMQDNVADTVLSQHTLYHIPRNEQARAVNEMYRVARTGAKIVIVYNWFFHSWFMNISLHVIQLYRIARHLAGKLYVRMFRSKPWLYFYTHSPRWFRRSFAFGSDIEFYCWRSVNKYFLDLYIHKWLGGEKFLGWLQRMEAKYPRFMGTFGDYPVIVITKQKKA